MNEVVGILIEMPAVALREELRIAADGAERLLEIVRRDVSELTQLIVRPAEFLRSFGDAPFQLGVQLADILLNLEALGDELLQQLFLLVQQVGFALEVNEDADFRAKDIRNDGL